MESLDDVLLEADDKMTKSVEVLKQGFAGLRTGKASPSLVENITVEYYGAPTRLRKTRNSGNAKRYSQGPSPRCSTKLASPRASNPNAIRVAFSP